MKIADKISRWIKDKVTEAGAKGAVFGLSGGIDSACVAVLCHNVFGDNVLGVTMPCESHSDDQKYVKLLTDKYNIKTEDVCLDNVYKEYMGLLPDGNDLSRANIKPRLRMITLYYYANNLNYLTIGTGNKSELCVGYFTKYGDGGVDLLPLADLYKAEVRELAKELGIPDELIKRPPTAGLWHGQTDEEELGITYEELDEILDLIDKGQENEIDNKDNLNKVKEMIKRSEHKRAPIEFFKKQGGI
jgi:NAD+ synthase